MKISNKRYKQLIAEWNPSMVVHIRYTTKHAVGRMTFSIAFFLEFNQKITKLFKGVQIREIYVKNELSGIVLEHFQSLPELWFYAIGRKYNG